MMHASNALREQIDFEALVGKSTFGEMFTSSKLSSMKFGNLLLGGTHEIKFNDGVNIVTPRKAGRYFDEEEAGCGAEHVMADGGSFSNSKIFYGRMIERVFEILKSGQFDELEDYTLFPEVVVNRNGTEAESKKMGVEVLYRTNNSDNIVGWKHEKTYRAHQSNSIWDNKKNGWRRTKDVIQKGDLTGSVLFVDQIPKSELNPSRGTLISVMLAAGSGFNASEDVLRFVGKVAKGIDAKEDVIVFSSRSLRFVYDEDLVYCLKLLTMLEEEGKQVILFYDNPLDYGQIMTVNSVAEDLGYDLCEMTEVYQKDEAYDQVTVKQAARQLCYMQDADYYEKIEMVKNIIRKAIGMGVGVNALGVSFGKDSEVLAHIVRQVVEEDGLEMPIAIFCDTGVEFPEHIAWGRHVAMDHFKFQRIDFKDIDESIEENPGVVDIAAMFNRLVQKPKKQIAIEPGKMPLYWVKPKTSFYRIIKEYGFPVFGKAIRPNKNLELHTRLNKLGIKYCGNKCCELLKKEPYKRAYGQLGVEMAFTGMMASESTERRELYYRAYKSNLERGGQVASQGAIYFAGGEGRWKAMPMIHMNDQEVWRYIRENELPYSPLYDMGFDKEMDDGTIKFIHYLRTGCWPCAMGIAHEGNNIEILRFTHNHLWKTLMFKWGMAYELYRFKKGKKAPQDKDSEKQLAYEVENYLTAFPCHLDNVTLENSLHRNIVSDVVDLKKAS